MEIRIRATGQVVSELEFRQAHENVCFPAVLSKEILETHGADAVLAAPAPAVTDFQNAVRDGAVQDSLGNWVYAWTVRNWTQEEIDAYKEAAKLSRWEAIKAERDRRKGGGVLVSGKWFHSDDASRIQQLGLVIMGANIPVNLQWKTLDGTFITMTQTLANQIFAASAASDQAIFAKAGWHKATMEASTNPAAYDFSQGWPQTYEETLV